VKKNYLSLLLSLVLLAACSPAEEVIPVEEKPIFRISYNTNLENFRPNLQTCADENTKAFFILQPNYPNMDEVSDLLIELGEPVNIGKFSAQVGKEKIVVITEKSNSSALDLMDLQNIFSGRTLFWDQEPELGKIQIWLMPMENNISQLFQNTILGGMLFSSNALVAPGPAEILEAVSNDPAAIAFLPQSWVNSSVHRIDLHIELPILALAETEPVGVLRDFVACLQGN
jgi:hypothetical protein